MKNAPHAALVFASLLAGCGGDGDESEEINGPERFIDGQPISKMLGEALHLTALQAKGDGLSERLFSPDGKSAYTGWVKEIRQNGKLKGLGLFKSGVRNGPSATWYESGPKQSEGRWLDGKQDGVFITWHESQQKKSEAHWQKGKQTGTWKTWHNNGQTQQMGDYKEGKREGIWIHFNEDGTEKRRTLYTGGLPF